MNPYKHIIKEEKALAVRAVVVSAMNTFQLPSKKNSVGASYEEIADKWLNLLPIRVLSKSHFTDGIDEHELKIPVEEIRQIFAYTYTQDGSRKKWFDWFHINYPLWMTVKRGYTGKYTIGVPTFNLIDQLTKIPAKTFVDAWALEYEANKNKDTQIDYIKIDTVNLGHYIEYCKGLNNESKKFQRATGRAIMIHKLALGLNNTNTCPLTGKVTHNIPQTYTVALSGRRYYTGSSALQSCSKAIRGASLGPCYEVDLSSSVYSYYKQLGVDLGVDTHILTELLSDKAGFRKALADCLTDTKASDEFKLKLVKEVTQAIGFGSDPTSVYSSVSKVIYNKEDYERLTTHPKFIALRKIYKDILACVKVNSDYKGMQKWYYKQTNNGKWTSFMAYLYQSYETIVMTELQERLVDKDILLWVHDGLYMKRKPIMMDIQYILDGLNKYATVDLEVHEKYTASSGTKASVLDEESAHKMRMKEQEQLAKEKYSSSNATYSNDADVALEQILREQGITL
jgi:hypothetical protein